MGASWRLFGEITMEMFLLVGVVALLMVYNGAFRRVFTRQDNWQKRCLQLATLALVLGGVFSLYGVGWGGVAAVLTLLHYSFGIYICRAQEKTLLGRISEAALSFAGALFFGVFLVLLPRELVALVIANLFWLIGYVFAYSLLHRPALGPERRDEELPLGGYSECVADL